jgi:hypothetical protein
LAFIENDPAFSVLCDLITPISLERMEASHQRRMPPRIGAARVFRELVLDAVLEKSLLDEERFILERLRIFQPFG